MEINITKLEQTEAFGKAIASFLVKSNDFSDSFIWLKFLDLNDL